MQERVVGQDSGAGRQTHLPERGSGAGAAGGEGRDEERDTPDQRQEKGQENKQERAKVRNELWRTRRLLGSVS